MLRLSQSQMHRAVPGYQRDFDARLKAQILQRHPDPVVVHDTVLAEYITAARQEAQMLGFRAEQHLLDLVEACCLAGPGLWQDTGFRAIMAAPMKTKEEKAVAVRRRFILSKDPMSP